MITRYIKNNVPIYVSFMSLNPYATLDNNNNNNNNNDMTAKL